MQDVVLQIWQFELVSHVLTLGYAAMAAALFYFILTKNDNSPEYRPSSVLSVVVMVSAAILLFMQQQSWEASFVLQQNDTFAVGDSLFTNGFRYLNWLIDVPMLLIQILFVAGIVGVAFKKYLVAFATNGVLMIVTGYIGQFYEPGRDTENIFLWIVWGVISTIFYVFVLIYITRVIKEGKANMEGSSGQALFAFILPLFYVAWTIYPVAYVMPLLPDLATGLVLQQVIYTIADISSKVIYGVILNIVSTRLSVEKGFKQA